MSASQSDCELIQKYLDRVTTPDELREIDARITKDRDFAREFAQSSRLHSQLHEQLRSVSGRVPFSIEGVAAASARAARRAPPKAKPPVFQIWRFGSALAAAVLFALGVASLVSPGGIRPTTNGVSKTQPASPLHIASFSGTVEILGEGGPRAVIEDVGVRPGDTIRTAEGASAVLALRGTATRVGLGSGSCLTIVEGERDLALRSAVGQFDINVDPTAGRAFWLDTRHADYDVTGTRFKATVTAEESRIEVEVGKVIFTGKDDEAGAPLLLAASSYAVARRGVPMEAGLRGWGKGPLVRLVCQRARAKVGETFSVSLKVLGASPFASWAQTLRFDPEHLALVKQEAGSFAEFVADSRLPEMINASGEVRAGGMGFEDNSGGQGVLGIFTFKVLRAVQTTIRTVPKSEEDKFGNLLIDMKCRETLPVAVSELVVNKGRRRSTP